MKFSLELFQNIWPELQPLLMDHYQEVAWRQDKIKLEPDEQKYQTIQDQDILKIFSIRDDQNKLIGYSVYFVIPSIHYSSTLFATNDVVFLAKEHRTTGLGREFLLFCEEELKNIGVQVISLHIKEKLNWSRLAANLHYEFVESTWLKWVGE